MVYTALEHGCNYCIVPADNMKEAQIVEGIRVVGVHLLSEVIDFLQNAPDIHVDTERVEFIGNLREDLPDFRDICGQAAVKRAVEVAVAGRHNILMVGPPGSGKTMIARRIPGIMPPLSFEDNLREYFFKHGLKHPLHQQHIQNRSTANTKQCILFPLMQKYDKQNRNGFWQPISSASVPS